MTAGFGVISAGCFEPVAAGVRSIPGRELHRLTERTPEFFNDTVGRHLESLETELATLQSEANKLAGEIEELTGEPAAGIE